MSNVSKQFIKYEKLEIILEKYPFLEEFLQNNFIDIELKKSIEEILNSYDEDVLIEKGINKNSFIENCIEFTNNMLELLGIENEENSIEEITIISGYNKAKIKEPFEKFAIKKGEIIVIVGPTGSGKSRLLADIEWGAQGDTPTKRKILINGEPLGRKKRFSSGNNLVAQLSQNMNFVMDLTVHEFLELHAKSRMVENEEEVINKIFEKANHLAGENFKLDSDRKSVV